jgi:hypothetical protein
VSRVRQEPDPKSLRRLSDVEKFKLGITSGGGGATTFDASAIVSGTMATARLGGGAAGAGVFLRGDSTWAAPGGATLADADYGDITVSGGGTVLTVDPAVVTYAKIQNVSVTDRVLGRSTAGAGPTEEIACTAAGRAVIAGANAAAQRTTLGVDAAGTDNSVNVTLAGAPTYITIAGQVITRGAVNLASEVTGDLPFANLVPATAISKLVGRGQAIGAGDFEEITLGTNLSMTGTTLNAAGGGGTPPTGTGLYHTTAGVMDAGAMAVSTGLTTTPGNLLVDTAVVEVVSRKGAVNGYCGLDAGGLVAALDLADLGTPSSLTVLYGDQHWRVPPGGGGNLYATVDFGSSFTHSASVVVTGQTWVGATSKIVATILSAANKGIEDSVLSFQASISDLNPSTGFTLNVYTPVKAKGTYTFSCMGV